MAKTKYSFRHPVSINKTSWFYINPKSIDLITEVRSADGIYEKTLDIKIPSKTLRAVVKFWDREKK